MAARVAVLLDERDNKIGTVTVPDTISVIRHKGAIFVRTAKGLRLSGGGIGVAFIATEVYVRDQLQPA